MMIKYNSKTGFTLVELMVILLFATLLLAAAAPIITKRVKDVPTKMNHGKYICYYDEGIGKLVEERYNSSIRTNRREFEDGEQCSFNISNKKAAMYKIEMIGAGAGGYTYTYLEDVMAHMDTTYYIGSGVADVDKIIDQPTDQELYNIFNGAAARIAAGPNTIFWKSIGNFVEEDGKTYYSSAYPGNGVKYTYRPVETTMCYIHTASMDDTTKHYYISDIATPNILPCNVNSEIYNEENMTNPNTCTFSNLADKVKERYKNGYGDLKFEHTLKEDILAKVVARFPNTDSEGHYTYSSVTSSDIISPLCVARGLGNFEKDGIKWKPGNDGHISSTEKDDVIFYGGKPGKSAFLYYNFTIDIPEPIHNVHEFLQSLPEKYVTKEFCLDNRCDSVELTGYSSVPGSPYEYSYNHFFRHKTWYGDNLFKMFPGEDKPLKEKEKYFNNVFPSETETGRDGYYAAIFMPDGSRVVTKTKAKGGTGAQIIWNPETGYIKHLPGTDGVSATLEKNVIPSDSGSNMAKDVISTYEPKGSAWPSAKIISNKPERYHTIGNPGGTAEPKSYFSSDLGSGCTITIPRGGAPIDKETAKSEIQQMEAALTTTVVCNDGKAIYEAPGGKYVIRDSLTATTRDKAKGDLSPDRNPETDPLVTTGADAVMSTFFNATGILTRYSLLNGNAALSVVGMGGHGSGIHDKCVKPYGIIQYQRNNIEGDPTDFPDLNREHGDADAVHCVENNKGPMGNWPDFTDPAGYGHGGAVMISW